MQIGALAESVTVTGASADHRPDRHRRRRQHRHRRAGRAAGDESQLLRDGRPAAGRPVLALDADGQRHHRLERAVEPRTTTSRSTAATTVTTPSGPAPARRCGRAARGYSGVRGHHQHGHDAEYGRAGGAIVNAVTKAGTNKFSGVAFGYLVSNALTSKDFIARQRDLPKAEVEKRDNGFVIGGPIVRNKAHFFFSLERQVDKPNRSRVVQYPTGERLLDRRRPQRLEHAHPLRSPDHRQPHLGRAVAARDRAAVPGGRLPIGPREASVFQDETDLDQTAVGTFTSVLGGTKVNTFRVAKTWEHSVARQPLCTRTGSRGRRRPASSSAKRWPAT